MSRVIKLGDVAHTRSGDKGNHVNIGVIAYQPEGYQYLLKVLTPERIKEYFSSFCHGEVIRYEVPHLKAFNFLLHNCLGHEENTFMRTDSQGKVLGNKLLQMELEKPDNYPHMLRE